MFQKALVHFKKVDPVLYKTALRVRAIEEIVPFDPKEYFVNLCDTIVSQQLSGKAAGTIWKRFLDLFPGKKITPKLVLALKDEDIRAVGCSWAKIKYIKDLAQKTLDGSIKFDQFNTFSEEEIKKELVQVKGIGPWTAEMFLMFVMGKPDIFSYGDLGLKNAIAKLPRLKKPETWSPFRSYASRVLWRSLEV